MLIINKGHSSLDIWPKIPNQGISSENMIFITWYNETIKQRKINHQQ